MKKKTHIVFICFIGILGIIELFLRTYFGFCDAVLFREDKEFEYIAQPNQKRFRFRNHINYNSFSMRSDEIDTSAIRILVFGDSVINGGGLTDQDSLATSILSDTLTKLKHTKVQFLNISAGSWGPDNCYAYLQKYGNFHAKQIFLVVSSHDAYDDMTFEKIVGVHPNYPDKQYSSAIYELVYRYLLPRIGLGYHNVGSTIDNLGINKKTATTVFNPGFAAFANYSKANGIPLTIYLHAEGSELTNKKYNEQGQEIITFVNKNNIQIIKDLDCAIKPTDYRDNIHLNNQGQKQLAKKILKSLI